MDNFSASSADVGKLPLVKNSIDLIAENVRTAMRQTATSPDALHSLIAQQVDAAMRSGLMPAEAGDADLLRNDVLAEVAGLGPLQKFMDDPEIEEIWINAPHRIFVARNGVSELTAVKLTDEQVHTLVERMLQTTGRRVDFSNPFVDASLPDGSRLHVTIPDITSKHWAVNIRKFSTTVKSLTDLVEMESLTQQAAEFLRMCVLAQLNIIVSGATQAGKTTMLNALLSCARPGDRIVTVEETFELNFDAPDAVAMQCRQASLEGTGEISLRRLIKEALRMRPNRIVVGEVREAESLDLLIALNSGLPGACSIHANSAIDALTKLCTLPLLAGRNIDASFVVPTVANCIDVVVHCELDRFGHRQVKEIIAPTAKICDGEIEVTTLFARVEGKLVPTGNLPSQGEKFSAHNLDPKIVLALA